MPDSTQPVQRVLLAGAVGQVKVSLKRVGPSIVRACDSLEPHLRESGLFMEAPFDRVHLIIQVAATEDRRVKCGPINSRQRELPVTVRVATDFVLHRAPVELDKDLRQLMIDAIIQAARKHGTSPDRFLELCRQDEPE